MNPESAPTPLVLADEFRSVLARSGRPLRTGPVSASITLGWRAMLKIKHVPFQLFDVTAFPLMMTLMFTFLFGGALAGSPKAYVQFLLPGIVVEAVLMITVYTGFGLNTDIGKGLYDRFRSMPIWQPAPIVGMLLGDVVRYSIASAMVIGLGLALGFRPGGGILGVLLAVALILVFATSVTWIWTIVGMMVKTPESVMTTGMLFLFPLAFVSNIFVDPATMPGWLQVAVELNPVTRLVNASRGLMHGQDVAGEVVWVLVASAILCAVFVPISLRMYHRER